MPYREPYGVKARLIDCSTAMHPSEVLLEIDACDHSHEVIVHRNSYRDGCVLIGYPVGQDGDKLLIELPRETMQGHWRLWVPSSIVVDQRDRA